MRRSFARDEEGQMVVLAAIMLLALLFFVGLAVDAGQLYVAKRTEQEAADAAAFAGAIVFYQSGNNPPTSSDVTAAKAAARTAATQNGYTDGVNSTTVVVNSPPTSGMYNADVNHVEVIITRQVKTSLVPAQAAFNPVRARGVAGAEPIFGSGDAVLALGQTRNPSILCEGNGCVSAAGGAIMSNSNGGTSLQKGGSGVITATAPAQILTNGGYAGGCCTPTALTAQPRHADSFAGYPKPVCPVGSSNCTVYQPCCASPLSPGVYSSMTLSSDLNIVLSPGVYIIRGGGITSSGNGTIVGTGVFIFVTTSTYPNAGASCSGATFSGDGGFSISAQTTGPYQGMVYYQDPNCAADFIISGNGSTLSSTGTFYMPSAKLSMQANGNFTANSQFIADWIDVSGNGRLNVTYNPAQNAGGNLPRLAE